MNPLTLAALSLFLAAAPHDDDAVPKTAAGVTFDGVWETTFGRMRLGQTGAAVEGTYSYGGGSTISGTVEKRKLTFKYQESDAAGEGWFELSPSGDKFTGKWKAAGSSAWQEWEGTR